MNGHALTFDATRLGPGGSWCFVAEASAPLLLRHLLSRYAPGELEIASLRVHLGDELVSPVPLRTLLSPNIEITLPRVQPGHRVELVVRNPGGVELDVELAIVPRMPRAGEHRFDWYGAPGERRDR